MGSNPIRATSRDLFSFVYTPRKKAAAKRSGLAQRSDPEKRPMPLG